MPKSLPGATALPVPNGVGRGVSKALGGRPGQCDMTAMEFLPVLFMVAGIVLVAATTLFVSSLLRPSNPYPAKNMPYECGMDPAGEAAGGRFKVQFFILAILLVVFDVETIFLFPWAVVLKDIGLVGYVEMFVFILLLLVGFAYAWLKGALEWEA
jgi:NADH-quinone oxidoreductase subunit A